MRADRLEHLEILVVDRPFHQQARAVDAALAADRDGAGQAALRGIHQVRVREHDDGGLAAQLESAGLQRLGGDAQDFLRGRAAADELNLVDAGVADHGLAHIGSAGDDVDDTGRKSGFQEQLAQPHDHIGRDFRRLQNDAVAGGKGGRHHHGCREQRPVPRNDRAHHAIGLVGDIIMRRTTPGGDGAAFDLVGPAAEVAELLGGDIGHVRRHHGRSSRSR